jgi:hypothetical protein
MGKYKFILPLDASTYICYNYYTISKEITLEPLVTDYDPSIQGLLAECEIDWGDPVINRENLVPYGIRAFDKALYGLDVSNGELDVILGPRKRRKTTFAVNILINYMTSEKPKVKPFTVVDTLESGMRPKRYRDTLIVNVASRFLMAQGHVFGNYCPVCNAPVCQELVLNPDYLYYNRRTVAQQVAIEHAMDIMSAWPLHIYGANPRQGDTRNLKLSVKDKNSRWAHLIEEQGAKIFIVDHAQQYSFLDEVTDYEKQLRAVAALSDMVAQHSIVCLLLSQVSLTSLREARNNTGQLNATGGTKAQEEANVIFSVNYMDGSGQMKITIEESRKSATFAIWQSLDDSSGAFFGEANTMPE